MIKYANKLGYAFTFLEGLCYPGTNCDVFKESNNFWQKMKLDAERAGETSIRSVAKQGNNSGYGKQIEGNNATVVIEIETSQVSMFMQQYDKCRFITIPHSKRVIAVGDKRDEDITHFKPCHLGVVILDTSHYSDTDSVLITKEQAVGLEEFIGEEMGKLAYELPIGYKIVEGRFMAPKTYTFKAYSIDGKAPIEKMRTKGFTSGLVTYEELMNMADEGKVRKLESKILKRQAIQPCMKPDHEFTIMNSILVRCLDTNCFSKAKVFRHGEQTYYLPLDNPQPEDIHDKLIVERGRYDEFGNDKYQGVDFELPRVHYRADQVINYLKQKRKLLPI
jgi:hypothetical protein